MTSILKSSFSLLLWAACAVAQAEQGVLHLELGDPGRRGREAPVTLDGITDTRTGDLVTPTELARRLADTKLLFVGEEHLNWDNHVVELRVIEALHDAGRQVLIGLEMYPYTEQASLEHWTHGLLTESGLLELTGWYENWSHHWGYYRDIFLYAQRNNLAMYGINVPRDVVKTVRSKGFEALDADVRAHLPPVIDTTNAEHRQLFRAYFDADDALHSTMPEEAREAMYKAQTTWDGAMGWNAAQAVTLHGGPNAIIVVLIGAGHVAYGLGAERQVAPHFKGKISSLIPVPIRDGDGVAVASVRASYANFLWGVPPESGPGLPVLGVSLMGKLGSEPTRVIEVDKRSSAASAGVQVGDVILRLDGTPISSTTDLQRKTGDYRWGDPARLEVRREGKPMTLTVVFRRSAPKVAP